MRYDDAMPKRIGLYFVSHHGQTHAIAERIGQRLANYRHDVTITDLESDPRIPPGVHEFDIVLIGAPLYIRRYPRAVTRFLRAHRTQLMRHPSTGFFSVSLTAARSTIAAHIESLGPLRELLSDIDWTPEWIASFGGAIRYRGYDPLTRLIMRRIASSNGGPTDTSRDHDLTNWDEVVSFADHLHDDVLDSPFRSRAISLPARSLDRLMPVFEQRTTARLTIPATPDEIRLGLEQMRPTDMPLGRLLANIRTIGRPQPDLPFPEITRQFGAVMITTGAESHEVIGGLVGRFWQRDFGIARLRDESEFIAFEEPGYTKVVTDFWFDDARDDGTVVRTETRIHSLGADAQTRFGRYWLALSPGIRLYMRSVLHGIRRAVSRRRLT